MYLKIVVVSYPNIRSEIICNGNPRKLNMEVQPYPPSLDPIENCGRMTTDGVIVECRNRSNMMNYDIPVYIGVTMLKKVSV